MIPRTIFRKKSFLQCGIDPVLLEAVGLNAELHVVLLLDVVHELDILGLLPGFRFGEAGPSEGLVLVENAVVHPSPVHSHRSLWIQGLPGREKENS